MTVQFSKHRVLIQRFCKALFALAKQSNTVDALARELHDLSAAMGQSGELRVLISSPLLRREQQRAAVIQILKSAGASDLLIKFAATLADKRRLFLLPAIGDAFSAMLADERGEVTAHVTTARALDAAQLQNLQSQIGAMLGGKKVAVSAAVDSSILGGVVVRVGSTMVDSSVRTKLDNLALRLRNAA